MFPLLTDQFSRPLFYDSDKAIVDAVQQIAQARGVAHGHRRHDVGRVTWLRRTRRKRPSPPAGWRGMLRTGGNARTQ
jgi:hypothetical protein